MDPTESSSRGSRSISRSVSATGLFLRKQLWIWPILAAIGLSIVGWWANRSIEQSIKSQMASNLQTILDADVTAMKIWLSTQRANATALAEDDQLRTLVQRLVERNADPDLQTGELLQSTELRELRKRLQPELDAFDYRGFAVLSTDGRILAADLDQAIGQSDLPIQEGLVEKVLGGESLVTRPFRSAMRLEGKDGVTEAGSPTMFVVAPIRDGDNQPMGILGLRIPPEEEFTHILQVARAGKTGETYAFDAQGVMLSQSRFDDDLRRIGLLADRDGEHSILHMEIRDPGVDMTLNERPAVRRSEQPLTVMATSAVAGESAVNVEGYRDYRGVPVIGAWTWLPEYGMGVTTEVDVAEAYAPLSVLRRVFGGLFALLVASAIAIFVFTVMVSRLDRQARAAAIKARQLGQYALGEKIGAGAMGIVYQGHHQMLRRPTAIKLLDADKTTPESVARFEREVQLTSQLNHPNTICIYDYGRTPEGVFYYAMELLEGLNLDQLVKQFGPQPEARVINILRQVCGSLAEAHENGLIHRDVKPANIFLSHRGGIFDFVKLLDFGLVKAVDGQRDASLTAEGVIAGTPMFLSPEAVQNSSTVTGAADLYAVGAVGYYLLTGVNVFTGANVLEICMHQVNTAPVPPSQRVDRTISPALEDVIMKCLEKQPGDRPKSADELATMLVDCQVDNTWTEIQARDWWSEWEPHADLSDSSTSGTAGPDEETMLHSN